MNEQPDDWYEDLLDRENNPDFERPRSISGGIRDEAVEHGREFAKDKAKDAGKKLAKEAGKTAAKEGAKAGAEAGAGAATSGGAAAGGAAAAGAGVAATTGVETAGVGVAVGAAIAVGGTALKNKTLRNILLAVVPVTLLAGIFIFVSVIVMAPVVILAAVNSVVGEAVELVYDVRSTAISAVTLGPKLAATGVERGKDLADDGAGFIEDNTPIEIPLLGAALLPHDPNAPQVLASQTLSQDSRLYQLSIAMNEKGFFKSLKERYGINVVTTARYQFDIFLDGRKIHHSNSINDALQFFATDDRMKDRLSYVMDAEGIYKYGQRVTFAESGMSDYQSSRLFIPDADKAKSDQEAVKVKRETIDTVNTPFFTQAETELECSDDCGEWVPTTVNSDQGTVTEEISPQSGFLPKNTLYSVMNTRVTQPDSLSDQQIIQWFNYIRELGKAARGESPAFTQGILDTRKKQTGRLWFNWQTQVDQLKAGKLTTKSGNTLFKSLANIGNSKAFHKLSGVKGGKGFREYEKINENQPNVAAVIYNKWREENGEDAELVEKLANLNNSWLGNLIPDSLLTNLFNNNEGVRRALVSAFRLGSEAMIPKCDSAKAGAIYFNCIYAGAETAYRDVGIKQIGTDGNIRDEDYQEVLAYAKEVDQKIAAQQPLSDRLFSIESRSSFARTALLNAVVPLQTSASFVDLQTTSLDIIGKLPSLFGSTLGANVSAAEVEDNKSMNNINPAGIRVSTLKNTPLSSTLNQSSGSTDTCPAVEGENMCKADEAVLLAMQAKYDVLPQDTGTSSFSFVIGTYNQKNGYSLEQHNRAAENIVQKMDVVGTQETGNPKHQHYKDYLSERGFGAYPDYNGGNRTCAQNQAIFYKKELFTFVKGEFFDIPRYPDPASNCGNGEQTSRHSLEGYRADWLPGVWTHIPIVWLQHKSGRTIIVINTHNVANVAGSGNTRPSYSRYISAQIYVDQIRRLKDQNPDTPIFLTGDFNEGTGVRTSGNVTYQGKHEKLLFCMFSENGLMKSVFEQMGCPARSIGGVDYIYTTPEIEVEWKEEMSRAEAASDHPVKYAKVIVPGASFRVASFNIYHSDDAIWRERLRRSVDVLRDNQIDVAGLQEMRPDQMQLFNTPAYGGSTYDMYPNELRNPGFTPNPIIWNKSKFTLLEKRSVEFRYFGGTRDKAPVLKFKVNETGQEFWFANTHDPADARGEVAHLRYQNAKDYAQYFTNLAREGKPIFFTGDFNSGYQVRGGPGGGGDGNDTYQMKRENLTYCILTAPGTGLWDAWDASERKNGACPSTNVRFPDNFQPNPTGPIDHIFMSRDVEVNKYFRALRGKQRNGSDVHDTIIAEVSLGDNGRTDDRGDTNPGGLAWPIARRAWPQRSMPVAECGLLYSNGTVHTGMDISVPTGTTVYAAADATVTYKGGSYGAIIAKTNLRTSDGTPIYINYQHLSQINVGSRMRQGDPIGKSGSVGTESPHLHFGVWKTGSFLSGHSSPSSPAGSATLSKMLHPMNYLPEDGRNVNECRKPYVVPNSRM